MPLLQDPSTILEFVKIVGRFPDIYDFNSETYKKFGADKSWSMVVDCLKNEIDLDTTVEELKLKWKGIRSSYSRYKSKLHYHKNSAHPPKKYYLWDALSYLDPFTKTKSFPDKMNESYFEEYDNDNNGEDLANSSEYDPAFEWAQVEIKPELTQKDDLSSDSDEQPTQNTFLTPRKRKRESNSDSDGELNFFRSLLPDLQSFSAKEMRTFKIGILQLIDKIENDRKK